MKILLQLAAAALFIALGLGAGQLYQWWSAPSAQVETRAVDLAALGVRENLPIMVSLSTCPVCKQAREWLNANGIEHVEMVIDESGEAKQLADALGLKAVPAFLHNGQQMTGFAPEKLAELLVVRR